MADLTQKINRIANNVTNSLNKVAGKGVTVPADANSDDLPGLIEAIETGGGGASPVIEPLNVTENGTYTAPAGVNGYSPVTVNVAGGGGGETEEDWVGDGNTHIWISLAEGRTSPMLGVCPNGTVTVDWGDGTAPDVLTGTSTSVVKWTHTHNYASAGDYIITLIADGDFGFYGATSVQGGSALLRYSSENDNRNYGYREAIRKIEIRKGATSIGKSGFSGCFSLANIRIPDGVTSIGSNTFAYCYSLANIRIPAGVTSIGNYAFNSCYSLANVHIPAGVTSLGNSMFVYCFSLANVHIPAGVTSLGNSVFNSCYSLANIRIPAGVTSIGSSAFNDCYSLGWMRFESTTPPTVLNSNAFTNIPTDCVISVPVGSLAAYRLATNYPDPATYTYIEED